MNDFNINLGGKIFKSDYAYHFKHAFLIWLIDIWYAKNEYYWFYYINSHLIN